MLAACPRGCSVTEPSEAVGKARAEQRTSPRVQYAIPLQISGSDHSGNSFTEPARTEVITRDGGMIITGAVLTTGSQVRLLHGEKSATARVVGTVGIRDEEMAYGIHIVSKPGEASWGVQFPENRNPAGAGRTDLHCTQCAQRQE